METLWGNLDPLGSGFPEPKCHPCKSCVRRLRCYFSPPSHHRCSQHLFSLQLPLREPLVAKSKIHPKRWLSWFLCIFLLLLVVRFIYFFIHLAQRTKSCPLFFVLFFFFFSPWSVHEEAFSCGSWKLALQCCLALCNIKYWIGRDSLLMVTEEIKHLLKVDKYM